MSINIYFTNIYACDKMIPKWKGSINMNIHKIAVIAGDGIGPEVIKEGIKVSWSKDIEITQNLFSYH